jgi:hypothetical protein
MVTAWTPQEVPVATWGVENDGDVDGPASSTDNAIARFNGTTGKIIQNSGVLIDDSDNITGVNDLTIGGTFTDGTASLTAGAFTGLTFVNSVTAVELSQLETIGATTISAAQWVFVGEADQAVKQADSPTFVTTTLTGLTASRLVGTSAGKVLQSEDLASWVTGTANQITVTDDADGTITLSTPQDIHSGATPTFASVIIGEDGYVGITGNETITFNGTGDLITISSTTTSIDGLFGIGTTTVPHGGVGAAKLAIEGANASTAGPHVQFTAASDDYPLMHILPFAHDSVGILFDSYYDGALRSSDASNYRIWKETDVLKFQADGSIAAGSAVTFVTAFQIEADAEIMPSPGAALKTYWRDANSALYSNASGYLDVAVSNGLRLLSDSVPIIIGADSDVTMLYDNTDFKITTDGNAASDLVLDCGTEKTLELAESVTIDLNFPAGTANLPAASAPGVVTFTDSAAADTGIATRGFAVDEHLSWVLEYNHQCVTDGNLIFHLHIQGDTAPTGTDKIQFQIDYTITHDDETCAAVTTITKEIDFDTQYEQVAVVFATLSGIGLAIGDQIKVKLTRIDASADEYGGEAKLCTFGAHVQVDTLGSRQVIVK